MAHNLTVRYSKMGLNGYFRGIQSHHAPQDLPTYTSGWRAYFRTSWRWTPFIHDSSHGAELSFYTRIYLNYHNLYSNYHNQFKIKYLWLYSYNILTNPSRFSFQKISSMNRFQSNLRFCNCAHGRGWDTSVLRLLYLKYINLKK